MKEITHTTHYWLFKKSSEDSMHYFVRVLLTSTNKPVWSIGYEYMGLVSLVGGPLSDKLQEKLEIEFSEEILKDVKLDTDKPYMQPENTQGGIYPSESDFYFGESI